MGSWISSSESSINNNNITTVTHTGGSRKQIALDKSYSTHSRFYDLTSMNKVNVMNANMHAGGASKKRTKTKSTKKKKKCASPTRKNKNKKMI